MLKQCEGSHAVAEAVALCRPEVICAYPISPQTHIVEGLGEMVKSGALAPCEFINVESEFAAMSVAIGASAGNHLGRGDRGDRRERGHAVADQHTSLDQSAQGRCPAIGDRPFEHVRPKRIDVDEDELLRHLPQHTQSGVLSIALAGPGDRQPAQADCEEQGERLEEEREERHQNRCDDDQRAECASPGGGPAPGGTEFHVRDDRARQTCEPCPEECPHQ